MIITMDSNEYVLHPLIVEGINKFLLEKQQIVSEEQKNNKLLVDLYKENKVIHRKLECGDFLFNNILVEHMTAADFGGKVLNNRIFQQAQDMLHSKEVNPELQLYIMISGNITDMIKISREDPITKKIIFPYKPKPMAAAWASLNRIGIPTSFVGDSWFFVHTLVNLFEKYYDGKERNYNPVRKPQEFDDIILSNYTSLVGEKTAKNLLKKFPIPKQLYNASKEQLLEVDKIGKRTAEFLVNFSEGREKSWKVIEDRKKLLKENKLKSKEEKNPNEIIEQKDLSLPKFI